eukprot:jgi/Ulvmu1/11487/UM077_0036.1
MHDLCTWLAQRDVGIIDSGFIQEKRHGLLTTLKADSSRKLKSQAGGGITCVSVDRAEGRFALASAQDGSLQCFDLFAAHVPALQEPVVTIPPRTSGGHKATATAVDWFPTDSGAFLSSSKDATAKLWDPNAAALVAEFATATPAHTMRMAPSTHPIAAVGCEDGCIRLLDIAAGVTCNTLMGYGGPVLSVAWCGVNEHQLVGGDATGELRLWDMRRAGTVHTFDQHDAENPGTGVCLDSDGGSGGDKGSTKAPGGHRILSSVATGGRAHDRAVTGLLQTTGGTAWVSAGADNAVRVWSVETHRNTLRRFPDAFNSAMGPRQIATDECGQVLYFPSGSAVTCYDLATGRKCADIRGHMATINAAAWSTRLASLITGSTDKQLLISSLPEASGDVCLGGDRVADASDGDAWSDDDNTAFQGPLDREGAAAGAGAVFSGGRRITAQHAAPAHTAPELQQESERGLESRPQRRGAGAGRAGAAGRRGRLGVVGGVGADRRAQQSDARITRIATQLARRLVRHVPQDKDGN